MKIPLKMSFMTVNSWRSLRAKKQDLHEATIAIVFKIEFYEILFIAALKLSAFGNKVRQGVNRNEIVIFYSTVDLMEHGIKNICY